MIAKKELCVAIITRDTDKVMEFYDKNVEFLNEIKEFADIVLENVYLVNKIKAYLNEKIDD